MADSEDQMMAQISSRLAYVYAGLVMACQHLPIEIQLPAGIVTSEDIVPAVRRVAKIVEDQPMPEEAQAALFGACVLFLGGADLHELLHIEYEEARAHSAMANLLFAEEALIDLAEWIDGQPDPEGDGQES